MDRKLAVCVAWPVAVVATAFLFALSPAAFGQGRLSTASNIAPAQPPPGVSTGESRGLPQDVLQVIRWLPEDTESIMLARGPLQDGILRDFHDPPPPPVFAVAAVGRERSNPTAAAGFSARIARGVRGVVRAFGKGIHAEHQRP